MEVLERDGVLEQLDGWLDNAAAGRGLVALLGAEAGGGKTIVVEQFRHRVDGHARVLLGACDPLSTPRPLGPLLDIAPGLGPELEELLQQAATRDRVYGALLTELRRPEPTIVVLEDMHWADEASLDLLRYLGRRIATTSALLLATYRDDEVGPSHPLRMVLGDLATSPNVRRLNLAPLSQAAIRLLANGSGVDPVALFRRTAGNPFFVTETLAAGPESQASLPPSVRDVVQGRAARLSAPARALLEVGAIIGPRIDMSLLTELTGPEVASVHECLARGLLQADGTHVSFRNELAREAVLDGMSPLRRLQIHRDVLKSLRSRPTGPDDLAQLAHHAEAANDPDAVLEYAPGAGRRAARLSAHREAMAQFQRALRYADRLEPDQRALQLEELAEEYGLVDQVPDAIEVRLRALEIWRASGNRLREGDSLRVLSRLYWAAARSAEAAQAMKQALEILEALPAGPELAWAYSLRAGSHMLSNESTEAIMLAQRAIALAEQFGPLGAQLHARNTLGVSLVQLGETERGLMELHASLQGARDADLEEHVVRGYSNYSECIMETPALNLAPATQLFNEGIQYADERDLNTTGACLRGGLSRLELLSGRWDSAAELAGGVVLNSADIHRIGPLSTLGRLRARRGDPEVSTVLDTGMELARRTGEPQWITLVTAARAEAAWLAGDQSTTRAEADAGLEICPRIGQFWTLSELVYWQWKSGGDSAPLIDHIAEPYALQIRGTPLEAAARWHALGCPYESARALAESEDAAALRRALDIFEGLGARVPAAQAENRLSELGIGGGGRSQRRSTRANPAGLTDREMDVLRLLAEDLRNAEIAEQLVLSARTVDHHVSSILSKLGARSRGEAKSEALRLGILASSSQTLS